MVIFVYKFFYWKKNYISTKDFLLILVFHDATIKLISYKKEE